MARKHCNQECRLIFYDVMCICNVVLSLGVGIYTNCVSLLADAFAQLAGVISVFLGIVTMRLGQRPPTAKYTYGYQRAELVGALVNASFLIGLCFSAALQAVSLYTAPEPMPEKEAKIVLGVGAVGITVNLIGVLFTAQCNCSSKSSNDDARNSGTEIADAQPDTGPDGSEAGEKDSDDEDVRAPPSMPPSRKPSAYSTRSRKASHYSLHSIATAITKPDLSAPWVGRRASVFPRREEDDDQQIPGLPGEARKAGSTGMKAVFVTVMSDALGSFVVVLVALSALIWGCHEEPASKTCDVVTTTAPIVQECSAWAVYVDPTLTIVNVAIVLVHTIALIPELVNLVLDATPEDADIDYIKQRLLQMDGVLSVHELHVRRLQAYVSIATVHLRVLSRVSDRKIQRQVKNMFHELDVHSTTVQLEKVEYDASSDPDQCEVRCPFYLTCLPQSCCGFHQKPAEVALAASPPALPAPPPTHAIRNVTLVVVSDEEQSQVPEVNRSPRQPRAPRNGVTITFDDNVTQL